MGTLKNGRFWRINSLGEIENDASIELVDPKFIPVINMVVETYKTILSDALESVYLTGSVSRGIYRAGESDIDFFAVVKAGHNLSKENEDDLQEQKLALKKTFHWIKKFDLEVWPKEWARPQANTFSIFAYVIQVSSVLLWGTDQSLYLPRYKLSYDIAINVIEQIRPDIDEALAETNLNQDPDNVKYWAARIAKNIIRACFCLYMMDECNFTWDIDLCAQIYLKHNPKHREDLELLLAQIQTPTSSINEFQKILSNISSWLIPDSDKWLSRNIK